MIKECFFFLNFNPFSLIIFYHSVWLGFDIFGLRVQGHSIGYSLRYRAKDITITIVIINPRKKMGPECGWRHAQKRLAENLEDFDKDSVEVQPWCWEIEIGPLGQTIEFLPLGQRIEFSTVAAAVIGAENRVLCHWGRSFAGPDQRRWHEI